jgi:glutaconate CoA-transferase subunit A
MVADWDLARAAKRLILTTERLVPNAEIRSHPDRTAIPYFLVDAVCEVPYGSYPGCMPYEYYSDEKHLREWLEAEEDPERYKAFLDRYIYGVKGFSEYLERCGGIERLRQLRDEELCVDREGRSGP